MDTVRTVDEIRALLKPVKGLVDPDKELPVLYGLVSSLKPGQVYFEIGTRTGRSALMAALSARDGVEIWTIDLACRTDVPKHVEYIQAVYSRFASFGVLHNAHFCPLSSTEMPWDDKPIDVLFIDGWHSPVGVKADVDKWSPFVPLGGKIAFHDAIPGKWAHYTGVMIQVERLRNSGDWEEEIGGRSIAVFKRVGNA